MSETRRHISFGLACIGAAFVLGATTAAASAIVNIALGRANP